MMQITGRLCPREHLQPDSDRSSSTSGGRWRTWWGRWLCCTCQYHCLSFQIFCEEVLEEEVLEEEAEQVEDDHSWHDDLWGECRDLQWWHRSSCSKSAAAVESRKKIRKYYFKIKLLMSENIYSSWYSTTWPLLGIVEGAYCCTGIEFDLGDLQHDLILLSLEAKACAFHCVLRENISLVGGGKYHHF